MLERDEINPIAALVAGRGGMSFRDYMEVALYHPDLGYYGAGRAALGRKGDFFTNVSVGPVFGRLMGTQFREMWERLGRPEGFTIVEQGANDGTFAADVLWWCGEEAPDFYGAMRYGIVEGIEVLRERQIEKLAGFPGKIEWWNKVLEVPAVAGIHFSNELIDAFPVHLLRFTDGEWRELWVTGEMGWREELVREAGLLAALEGVPRIEGYTTEVNLDARGWAREVAERIERGWVLTIDYGFPRERYYAPERVRGTLECYAEHVKGLDPLARAGFCDLTAHVEFTSLARAFEENGMGLAGYTDQHHFLTGLLAGAFGDRPPTAKEARELKTLLHPEMLGTSFQVLAVGKGVPDGKLSGFQYARGDRP